MYLSTFFLNIGFYTCCSTTVSYSGCSRTDARSDLTAGKWLGQRGDWSCGELPRHSCPSCSWVSLLALRLLYVVSFASKCCAEHQLFGRNLDACKVADRKGQPGRQSRLSSLAGAGLCQVSRSWSVKLSLCFGTTPVTQDISIWALGLQITVLTSGCIEHLYLVNLKQTVL